MGRSPALPLILLAAGAFACASAVYALWRQAFPPASPPAALAIVSGSSLAESLHGETVRGTCGDCGRPLRFAVESLPRAGDARCPDCGAAVDVAKLDPAPADRVTVRPLAEGEAPRIGGLYVFAAPEGGDAAPIVKRIVAAPGQRVTIAEGDLFLDGVRVRKDPRDERWPRVVVGQAGPAVDRPAVASLWERESRPGRRLALEFRPRAVWAVERPPAPILDSYPSQAVERRRLNPVWDVRVAGELQGDEPSAAEFLYRDGSRTWTLRIGSAGDWSLSLGEAILAKGSLSDWSAREAFDFGMLDRQLFLIRPNRETIVVRLDEAHLQGAPLVPSLSPLGIVVGDGVAVADLRVERDVHYLPPAGADEPWGEREAEANVGWFALGDYPSYSRDSRHFGRFPREAILGEALLPPLATDERK